MTSASPQGGAPTLGTAENFGVLGASAVTNTGPTVVDGDLGVSPGNSVTGFPPGNVNGVMHIADAVALQAQADANTAYIDLAGRACNQDLSGMDLGGLTLIAGVYCFSSSAQLTGPLILDAEGNPAATWIFQIGSTLTTASTSSVSVINGGSECNVFWQVGSSATLGTETSFVGDILALTSITLVTGSDTSGRLIALNGAVTLDSNQVSPACVCLVTATVVDLGPGCGSSMLAISPPVMGQTVTISVTGAPPGSFIQLHMSDCGSASFLLGNTGCTIYIDPVTMTIPFTGFADGNGDFSLGHLLSTRPGLLGLCLVLQVSVWDPVTGFHSVSNGLQVLIGCK